MRVLRARLNRAFGVVVLVVLTLLLLQWAVGAGTHAQAASTQALTGTAAARASAAAETPAPAAAARECGTGVNAQPERRRQVNLVIDDSGSMFFDGTTALDRWSNAKYSLEVFAAMMGEDDTLNVYRMSDFGEGATAGPLVSMRGGEPASDRVAKIHAIQLQGGGTPYAPVPVAAADLALGSAPDKWLVILSDGEFNDRATAEVQSDLTRFAAEGTANGSRLQVAFLAIGPDAPTLTNDPAAGVFFEAAPQTAELLGKMTAFSNMIFARTLLPQSSPGQLNPDVDLDQVLVFAQGADVKIGALTTAGTALQPESRVQVSWVKNQDALVDGAKVPAVPNEALRGTLASFVDVPAGTSVVDIQGAQTVDVFYSPHVAFGIELTDAEGARVDAEKIVGGEYTVNFGFMNADCEFIESDLFGDVEYSAEVIQNGELVAESFAPGDVITLQRGDAQFAVKARYLEGKTSEAVIDLHVLRPAKPTAFRSEPTSFAVSKLPELQAPEGALRLHYAINENGTTTEFGTEEWASFSADSFTVTSTEPGLDFEISVGEEPGAVFLVPRAPGGDIYEAATGEIPVSIEASHVYDEQLNESQYDTTLTITDDISFWDRAVDWFAKTGWKWLLALIVLIWVLGYVFRRRLPKKMRQRPLVDYRPKALGGRRAQFDAKFERNRGGLLIPYAPETGTIKPPSAMRGMPALKIKAVGGGRFDVTNWKSVAANGRVSFDGEQLTKETTKVRSLRGSSVVTVASPEGSYDMQLNQTRSPGRK